MEIGSSVVVFGTMVNAGLVYSNGRGLVVDTMYGPAQASAILDAANAKDVKVDYVFNTHSHFDHVFGNSVFGAPVVASALCAKKMWSLSPESIRQMALNNPHSPGQYEVTMPSLAFSDSLLLQVGSLRVTLEIYGGHTPGSAVCIVPSEGVVFSGDLLFIGRYPYVGEANLASWCRSLRRLKDKAKGFAAVVPGHGPVLTGDSIESGIGSLLSFLEDTLSLAGTLVDRGVTKEEALVHPGFPRVATQQPDAEKRRAVCIEKAYDEASANGRR